MRMNHTYGCRRRRSIILMFVFIFISDFLSIYALCSVWRCRRSQPDRNASRQTGAPCQKFNWTQPNEKEENMFSATVAASNMCWSSASASNAVVVVSLRFCSSHHDKLIKWICIMMNLLVCFILKFLPYIFFFFFHFHFFLLLSSFHSVWVHMMTCTETIFALKSNLSHGGTDPWWWRRNG